MWWGWKNIMDTAQKRIDELKERQENLRVDLTKMKQIPHDITSENELLNEVELSSINSCESEKIDTDLLSFSDAFGYFRQCLGSDSSFQWKGSEYTTILLEEVIIQMADSVQVDKNSLDTEISQIR